MGKGIRISGTLIVAVLYKEGIVVSADAGGRGGAGGEKGIVLKDQKKVFQINENVIIAASGTIKIADPDDPTKDRVNAVTLGREYFDQRAFEDTEDFWKGLQDALSQGYSQYFSQSRDELPTAFQLVIFYKDHQAKIRLREIDFSHDGKSEIKQMITPEHWFYGLFASWGWGHIPFGLLEGERRLQALAKHPSIKPFLDRRTLPRDITLDKALLFTKKIMEASSQLEPSRDHVARAFFSAHLQGDFRFAPTGET